MLEIQEIYEKSFSENERRNFDDLLYLIKNNKQINIENFDENAFIIYWTFDDFVFIEYFAVDEKFRGGGLGTNILKIFLQKNRLPIILEVALPNTEIDKKRIAFYERFGFVLHSQKYIQPPYSIEKQEIEMCLMSFGKIDFEKNFEKIKNTLYREVYNVKD